MRGGLNVCYQDEELQNHTLRLEAKVASLTTKLREHEEKYEQAQAELKQTKWDSDDKLLEKDRVLEHLRSEMQDLEDQHQATVAELKQQLWKSERESLNVQEKLKDVAMQLQMQKEKEKVHRQELVESTEKQEDLKREIVTLNLRWENKWQEHEQDMSNRSELRIRELQQVKDRLMTEKQATEERLVHAENELQRLRTEVYALRSNARIAESFGAQYYDGTTTAARQHEALGSRSSGDVRSSVGQEGAAASPLWSEDNGELSPIAGISPLLSDTPTKRGSGGDGVHSAAPSAMSATGASLETLQLENAKLRGLCRCESAEG